MSPLDAFWHLGNFVGPALFLGAFCASVAWLLWRAEVRAVGWWRAAAWGAVPALVACVGGLAWTGRDGGMATYAAMVAASAAGVWGRCLLRSR